MSAFFHHEKLKYIFINCYTYKFDFKYLQNLPATNATNSDEIEFENLPQILYVHPSPEVFLPNISFTFVVQNKWRNGKFIRFSIY